MSKDNIELKDVIHLKDKKFGFGALASSFLIGVIIGSVGIYLLSWRLGILQDPRLDYIFK